MTHPADIFFNPLNDKFNFKNRNIGLSKRAVNWEPTLYPLAKLSELTQIIRQEKSYSTTIRYLVDLEKNLWFAKEGAPSKTIPAHCLAAGNIEFSADYQYIQMINHKSGDFRPNFESIAWLLAILIANKTPLKEDLRIEHLTPAGGYQNIYILSSAELTTWFLKKFPIEIPCFTHQPQENKTVVYPKTSGEARSIATPSVAKRSLFFDEATPRDVKHSFFRGYLELEEEEDDEESHNANMTIK